LESAAESFVLLPGFIGVCAAESFVLLPGFIGVCAAQSFVLLPGFIGVCAAQSFVLYVMFWVFTPEKHESKTNDSAAQTPITPESKSRSYGNVGTFKEVTINKLELPG
jgi:fructose-specific phosphotransferase system IIC component